MNFDVMFHISVNLYEFDNYCKEKTIFEPKNR